MCKVCVINKYVLYLYQQKQIKIEIMTTHIKNKIETILFNGGFVEKELKKFIDVLEDIRGVESINREFKESFDDIEKRKGQISESIKTKTFSYINSTEKYNYEKGELH